MIEPLRNDKILETAGRIHQQIEATFPESGLSGIAADIVDTTATAAATADAISRPNRWILAGQAVLILFAVGGLAVYLQSREGSATFWQAILKFWEEARNDAAILIAAAVFLFTLDTRLKRRRALRAVHELRAIAHLIDMHQLTKSPALLGTSHPKLMVAGKALTPSEMARYLHFCTELLAVASKIGQLYVQDFPDSAAQTSVDHFEELATGLSSKIWQKLMVLDRTEAMSPDGRGLSDSSAGSHANASSKNC